MVCDVLLQQVTVTSEIQSGIKPAW